MSTNDAHLAELLPCFAIREVPYKTIGAHAVEASVWLPKLDDAARAQPRPVCVNFHGGDFVAGSRLSLEYMSVWKVELMRARGAVMVDADYRLLPEANGRDILADIADLLRWLPTHLPALAAQEGLTVDLRRTLFTGGSAGSWLAMQGALRHGTGTLGFPGADSAVKVVAVLSQFGILNNAYTPTTPLAYLNMPKVPTDLIAKHLAAIAAGEEPAVCTGARFPARGALMACSLQNQMSYELLGGDAEMNPMEVLSLVRRTPPPIWAFHGTDDSVVHADLTRTFAQRARELYGDELVLKETYMPGEHGVGRDAHMDEGWVHEGLEWMKSYW